MEKGWEEETNRPTISTLDNGNVNHCDTLEAPAQSFALFVVHETQGKVLPLILAVCRMRFSAEKGQN
jgi:hypothetical protein